MPSRVDFLDGSKVLYTYDAKGNQIENRLLYCLPMKVYNIFCCREKEW